MLRSGRMIGRRVVTALCLTGLSAAGILLPVPVRAQTACTAADIIAQDPNCPAGVAPCRICKTFAVSADTCTFDFGSRAVTLCSSGKLTVSGRRLTIIAGSFTIEPAGFIDGRGTLPPTIAIQSGGPVWIQKLGTSTNGRIDVSGDDEGGAIDIRAQGSVTIDGRVEASNLTTFAAGGSIDITALGPASDIVVSGGAGTLAARGGNASFGGGRIYLRAGRDIVLQSTVDISGTGGGSLLVHAGGEATVRAVVANGTGVTLDKESGGEVDITAGTLLRVLDGINCDGADGGSVSLTGGSGVIINGKITANRNADEADGGSISVESLYGDITVDAPLEVAGTYIGDGGNIELIAAGAATVRARLTATGGGIDASGGDLTVAAGSVFTSGVWNADGASSGSGGSIEVAADAGGILTTATSVLSVAGDTGSVTLSAEGHSSLAGNIIATAGLPDAAGGTITIDPGPYTLAVTGTVDARVTSTTGFADGTITIEPACDVRLSGTLRTRNTALAGGSNRITYRNSFDATGGTLLADEVGRNTIFCRCADMDAAGVCGSPLRCETPPVLDGATLAPPADVEPVPLQSCTGCGNGAVELGEECDDGNVINGDGCDANCTVSACGNGIRTGLEECDDGNLVDGDGCDSNCRVTGCGNGVVTAGEQCDDGNLVDGDCCSATCQAEPAGQPCVDGNPCTENVCDGAGRCGVPNTAPCNDGNPCTTGDTCTGGACVGTRLSDGAPCGVAGCKLAVCAAGECAVTHQAMPDGSPCNDGNACTAGDTCAAGVCGGGGVVTCDPCCAIHTGPGCESGSCQEACVCAIRPSCCSQQWDSTCMYVRAYLCAAACPGCTVPTPTASPTPTDSPTASPTPTWTPTWTRSATPTSTPVPRPTATASPSPGADTALGLCTTSGTSNPCVSGGGPQNTDCFLEWVSRPVPARKRDGRPRNLLVCYEGDPACDVDGVADNQACTIELRMCINNHDPRLPACVPSGVKSFEVKVPSLKSRDPADLVNRETLETHGGAGGLSLDVHRGKAALYAGTINAMPDRCVGPMAIQVPLRRSRSGKLSAGRRALRVKVTDSLGRADNNVLAIQCRPSTCGDGVIQSDREDCDQGAGNRVAGDGCDAACRVEPGWQCSGKPSVCSRSFPAGAFPDF